MVKVIFALSAIAVVGVLAVFWLWTPDKDRRVLESRYSNGSADFVEVAGLRLHVRDSGPRSAPTLIFLHGFGSSLHTWEPWATVLASDHRVIRFDLPGAGLTSADTTGNYTDARGAEVVIALMDMLGVMQASVIGHSMGGRLAWHFAAEHPSRLNKLVLIAPDGFASPGFEYGKPPEVPKMFRLMQFILPKPVLRMSLRSAYANPSVLTEDLLDRYYDMMLAPNVRASMIAKMEQSVLRDPVPALQRITAPTLLVWGDRDAMIPISNATDYLRVLPGSTLVTLSGVGHLPQEEAPEIALSILKSFLAQEK